MSWHYTCNNKTFFNKFDSIKEFLEEEREEAVVSEEFDKSAEEEIGGGKRGPAGE